MKKEELTPAQWLEQLELFKQQNLAKLRSPLTARYYPKNYEVNNQPSQTIPDQTMSLKTILERYARGLPIEGQFKDPIYENDPDAMGIDIRSLDLVDRENLKDQNQQRINELQNSLQAQQDAIKNLPSSDTQQPPTSPPQV
jgi:hypothetical protein